MKASTQVELRDNAEVKMTVKVPQEEVQRVYDGIVKENCKDVQIKGFRRGKVPPEVLIRKFGETLLGETAEKLVRETLEEALEETEKRPLQYATPSVEMGDGVKLEEDFQFEVTYDSYPDVTLGPYKELELKEPQCQITDDDLGRELKAIQDQNAVVIEKKSETLEKGDVATIDYVELNDAGKAVENTRREGFVFELGTGNNLYHLDDELVGMKRNEEKALTKSYDKDFEHTELAGREVKLLVKVTGLRERQLPELDDELAQDVSDEYETLDDLKKAIRENLETTAKQRVRERVISQLLDIVVDASVIPLPKTMVDMYLESDWREFVSRSGGQERAVVTALEQSEQSKESLLERWRAPVERRVKLLLAVRKLAEEEKIEISDDAVEQAIRERAEGRNVPYDDLRGQYEQGGMLEALRGDLSNEKLYEHLIGLSKIKKGDKLKFLDLVSRNS